MVVLAYINLSTLLYLGIKFLVTFRQTFLKLRLATFLNNIETSVPKAAL